MTINDIEQLPSLQTTANMHEPLPVLVVVENEVFSPRFSLFEEIMIGK